MRKIFVFLVLFASCGPRHVEAQTFVLSPVPRLQFFNNFGTPLVGGKVWTCLAGASCPGTPAATYTNASGAMVANANPVILDSSGRATIFLSPNVSYKFAIQTAAGAAIYTQDGITGAGGTISTAAGGTGIDTSVSNGIPSINGGTWQVNAITTNGVAYGGSSNGISFTSAPVSNSVLTTSGGAPIWSTTPRVTRLGIGQAADATTVLSVGPTAPQMGALISARRAGNDIEFGHDNTAGYGSSLGSLFGSGNPYICFSCEAGTTSNTFKTRGNKGSVFAGDLAGGFMFKSVDTASADNQSYTSRASLSSAGIWTWDNYSTGVIVATSGAISSSTSPSVSRITATDTSSAGLFGLSSTDASGPVVTALTSMMVVDAATSASSLRISIGGGYTQLSSGRTGSGSFLPFQVIVNSTNVFRLGTSGSDRTCIYVNGGLRLLQVSGGAIIDGGACGF